MLNLPRYFSFKIISIIFLFFSLANGQGEPVIETADVLYGLTSSLGDLGNKGSLNNLEDSSMFLGFLKEIKEDLNSEKNKLEEFEDYFWSLCNLLNKSNSSKEEKLKSLLTNVQNLNCLFDSGDSIIGLDEVLKDKIFVLADLIRLFINNDGIDLEKLGQENQSISQAIEAIVQFLNSDVYKKQTAYKEVVADTRRDERLDAQHLDAQHLDAQHLDAQHLNVEHLEAQDSRDIEDFHNLIDVKLGLSKDNIDQEEAEKISKEEVIVFDNINIDNTDDEDEVSNKELLINQDKKTKKQKPGKIINISMQDVANAGKVAVRALHNIGDYRLGGYPIQFVHQLLRHMDKVYNK